MMHVCIEVQQWHPGSSTLQDSVASGASHRGRWQGFLPQACLQHRQHAILTAHQWGNVAPSLHKPAKLAQHGRSMQLQPTRFRAQHCLLEQPGRLPVPPQLKLGGGVASPATSIESIT
jgi:hypothetical protein